MTEFFLFCLTTEQMIISMKSACYVQGITFSIIFLIYRPNACSPRQWKKGLDVRLEPVIFAPDDDAVFRTVTVAILHHNMDVDPCLFMVRTGDVQLPRCLTVVPWLGNVFHQFYFILKPGIIAKFTLLLHKRRGKGDEKTLHDDFVLFCIHLAASSQSVQSCLALVDHSICA